MKKILNFFGVLGFALYFNHLNAQIPITTSGQIYNQNFDSLGTNDVAWTNEVTLPGWFYVSSTNGVDAGTVTNIPPSNGSGPLQNSAFHFGALANSDRALGSRAGAPLMGFSNEFFYGTRFINNSPDIITNVNVSYTGEQWRSSGNSIQTISFFHRVGAGNFIGDPANSGWTAAPALNFTNVQSINQVLDGNNPTNQVILTADLPVTVNPGEEFWIRWSDLDEPATSDHYLGVDDLNITFTGIAAETNNPVNPSNTVLGVSLELKRPKVAKKLVFKGLKGFKVKAFLRSTNTLTKASYAAFGGSGTNNAPTNLTFTDFNKFQVLTKGKLFKKKGVNVIAQTKGAARAGAGIAAGSSPVTLVIRVEGVQGTNNASAFFTNLFTNVKVK